MTLKYIMIINTLLNYLHRLADDGLVLNSINIKINIMRKSEVS